MYILSQNEQDLYNYDNISCISIIQDSDTGTYSIWVAITNNSMRCEVGCYSSYKNAKTVMEELAEFISTKSNYIMPKNEEVEELWKMENTSQEQSQQL